MSDNPTIQKDIWFNVNTKKIVTSLGFRQPYPVNLYPGCNSYLLIFHCIDILNSNAPVDLSGMSNWVFGSDITYQTGHNDAIRLTDQSRFNTSGLATGILECYINTTAAGSTYLENAVDGLSSIQAYVELWSTTPRNTILLQDSCGLCSSWPLPSVMEESSSSTEVRSSSSSEARTSSSSSSSNSSMSSKST
jgi:hypothetical protein